MLEAEGRKEAAFRDAEARERSAEAEAKATEMVCDAIAKGNVQAINYFVANNYVKALEAIAKSPNQKILMMPLEASSVIGSLAGLAADHQRGVRRRRRGGAAAPRRAAASRSGSVPHDADARTPAMLRRRVGGRLPCRICPTSSSSLGLWNWFILGGAAVHRSRPSSPACISCGSASRRSIVGVPRRSPIEHRLAVAADRLRLISVLTVFWVRRYAAPGRAPSDLPDLNVRGAQYVGRS